MYKCALVHRQTKRCLISWNNRTLLFIKEDRH